MILTFLVSQATVLDDGVSPPSNPRALQYVGVYKKTVMREIIRPARPRPTALLPPSSDGKPEAAAAVVVAPDDVHEDARNMLKLYLNDK
jgi:hypothetical protein